MSPLGGRRCPPALLALLLGLAGSRGFWECQNQTVTHDVTVGGSLCLVPEKPPRAWIEILWKWDINSGKLQKILTVTRDEIVSYPQSPFHGRAKFQQGNLSLCISPVHREDNGVYWAEFEISSGEIIRRCFRMSVWDPVLQPELISRILQRDWTWCRLVLVCFSPGNVSYSWACTGDGPEPVPEPVPGSPSRLLRSLPEGAEPQICLCNVSNPAGWSVDHAALTCPGELP
ncbi:CD48 antigen-like [Zonotrichia albicollis]|uniref:CD48 antigen-like n=1 Tax=Zonotrichia albicollis TaxID=44394 RepID=UPI003D812502